LVFDTEADLDAAEEAREARKDVPTFCRVSKEKPRDVHERAGRSLLGRSDNVQPRFIFGAPSKAPSEDDVPEDTADLAALQANLDDLKAEHERLSSKLSGKADDYEGADDADDLLQPDVDEIARLKEDAHTKQGALDDLRKKVHILEDALTNLGPSSPTGGAGTSGKRRFRDIDPNAAPSPPSKKKHKSPQKNNNARKRSHEDAYATEDDDESRD